MEIPPENPQEKREDEGIGPLVAIIIIVGLMAAGGIYFLVTQEVEQRAAPEESQALLP